MKRLFGLVMVSLFALSACNQSSPVAESGPGDKAEDAAGAKGDTASPAKSSFHPQTQHLISSDDVPLLEQIDRENERVVAAATPSVVRITAIGPVDPHAQMFGNLPFKLPFGPNSQGMKSNAPSYGSGVIISKDGYIVTNNHVIEDALTVEVQLRDQRTFPARVVAADSPSDVAVLKIAASGLPAIPWGDSDKVEVGQQVFAIGNPFDLDDSVSKGLVSAKGRQL
jgi:serine protease Do